MSFDVRAWVSLVATSMPNFVRGCVHIRYAGSYGFATEHFSFLREKGAQSPPGFIFFKNQECFVLKCSTWSTICVAL